LLAAVLLAAFSLPSAFADPECASYDDGTIEIECDASIADVAEGVSDDDVLSSDGDEWVLDASIVVRDGATLSIDGADVSWLKIAGDNGIIVDGELEVDGVTITSWDEDDQDVIDQDSDGSEERAFVQIRQSERVSITDSEFGYLGYNDPGSRGFDVFGGTSSNIEIRGSEFHNMWMAFYSNGASDIVIDGNEYRDNIKYALDPHTGTSDMQITNNHLHHNPIGVICSWDCHDILIEGNEVNDNTEVGIFLSRNMHDSIVRNNELYNENVGIVVSESPDNEIYNNSIEASATGILLFNPTDPDDGETEDNVVWNNSITGAEFGIHASRSQDNILEDNELSDIESSEYHLSGDSSFEIRNQSFNDDEISGDNGSNNVEISDSGVIEVDDDEHDTDRNSFEEELDGESIIVDSQ
jgi:poly(beta-D-mannuronate) C5 epimerase